MILVSIIVIHFFIHILYSHLWNYGAHTLFFRLPIAQIKSTCVSLLIKALCLSKPKLPLLGLLITFINDFQFNLVLI